ncbi:MAG: hypothetical protein ACO2ON_03825 [Candidatus Nanopusillus sp.]
MGYTIINKLTNDIYIIREGKGSIKASDYIAYIISSESQNFIKILSIKEVDSNVRRGLNKLIEPILDDSGIDWNKDFNKFIAFVFLLKVKLFIDYILKKGLDKLPLIKAMSIKKENISIAYQLAYYLKDNDPNIALPEIYYEVILDPELFPKFFGILNNITFRSNPNIVRMAFLNFNNELSKYFSK